jgi:hypothetical protein
MRTKLESSLQSATLETLKKFLTGNLGPGYTFESVWDSNRTEKASNKLWLSIELIVLHVPERFQDANLYPPSTQIRTAAPLFCIEAKAVSFRNRAELRNKTLSCFYILITAWIADSAEPLEQTNKPR